MAIEGLSLLIYLDHNVDPLLAGDARAAGYSAVAAIEVGNAGLKDTDQLAWATGQGRAILTHDFDDYPRLAIESFSAGRDHAGIMLCRQLSRTVRCCADSYGCSTRSPPTTWSTASNGSTSAGRSDRARPDEDVYTDA